MRSATRSIIAVSAALATAALAAVALVPSQSAQAELSVHLTAAGDFSSTQQAAATLATVAQRSPDAHVALGDLAYDTNPETQWCDFVKSKVGEGFPFELLTGNHESNGPHGHINNFSSCLPNQIPGMVGTYGREYYFDLPRAAPLVRVINISAGQAFPDGTWNYATGDAHYKWTSDAIDKARAAGIPWIVVNTHFPCLSASTYGCVMPSSIFTLLQQKKVDLVLTGHDHAYMRTHQLQSGTAACPSIRVDGFDPDCLADQDSDFAAGRGTVFATVGTGGVALRDIDTGDTEFPYFAATSGLNRNPTWGVLDIQATSTALSAGFVRSTGGTFTDAFTIRRGPNQPPVAAFTSTTSGLNVIVDGSGSSDPEGSVASYQWAFGDGTTATGATPAPHAYAAPGTYAVSLTVTDSAGATGTVSRDVTVAAPPPGAPATPVGLSAVAAGQTKVDLKWSSVGGATEYRILRDGVEVGRSATAGYQDSGLSPETSYAYAVRAANADGVSPASTPVSVKTRTYAASGDRWRVNDAGVDLGTGWRSTTFNDSAWRSGPTQIGYGDGDEATLLNWGPSATNKPITNYARLTFDAGSDISNVKGLALRALIDDGAVVYLNGSEVWRFNLPTGTISATTKASRFISGAEEQQWRTATLPVTGLRQGTNTIAVEVHQDAPSSSDVSLDLELRPTR